MTNHSESFPQDSATFFQNYLSKIAKIIFFSSDSELLNNLNQG